MITIVNYGSGNIRAIANIYERLRVPYLIADTFDVIAKAEKIILPGVGAFDETMRMLNQSGLKEALEESVLGRKVPVLGICVGMQILAEGSDEGVLKGLGWIKGQVKLFDKSNLNHKPKLPHLGWNSVSVRKISRLLTSVDAETGFYFIHSYYFNCLDEADILTSSHYGIDFASSVNRENIFGVQFHPEKSHHNGISLLKNFASL
jgi:glutamine amidotransferase